MNNYELLGGIFVLGLIIILLIIVGVLEYQQENEFQKFAKEHCKIIGYMKGKLNTGWGVGYNGAMAVVMTEVKDKKGYQCDDGMQYWR